MVPHQGPSEDNQLSFVFRTCEVRDVPEVKWVIGTFGLEERGSIWASGTNLEVAGMWMVCKPMGMDEIR